MKTFNVGVLLFDDVELLDFSGPAEVFGAINELEDKKHPKVTLVYLADKEQINCKNGTRVLADAPLNLAGAGKLDVLVVPGGLGARKAAKNPKVIQLVKDAYENKIFIICVCTGSFILEEAGLFQSRLFTTHRSVADEFKDNPNLNIKSRIISDDAVITTAGVTAGIEGALLYVREKMGKSTLLQVTEYLEYPYFDPFKNNITYL
ncbi:MAG: DJ-1/PfpI family protein [Cyclobacteriaceae bacterium]|nr:DJ-1/PfpI family protein [Cyclobacteriaceae bacterium]MCH8514846.1 DJ-1/PfpI family protein [Cyclobacteriaceae bacterium]